MFSALVPKADVARRVRHVRFAPIKQVQLRRFNGDIWELFGPVLSSEIGG